MGAVLSLVIVILDQFTKKMIAGSMQLGESVPFIGRLVELTYIHNDGAAYSILKGKQTLLIVFTIVLMIAIVCYLYFYRKSVGRLEKFALYLILGGGAGNLIDRIMYGYVIDFINTNIIPVFNVADIAITCGCILFAISVLFSKKE